MNKPKAEATGTLAHIGINADCYVLSNGTRLLSQRGIVRALSGGREAGNIAPYLARLPNASALVAAGAIEFEMPGGGTAIGRDAQWFVDMLKAYKAARRARLLHKSQQKLAERADVMLDALAGIGIVALIDEATGYEHVRATGDLARLFDRLLLSQADRWAQMWPEDVVASLCKTYGIQKDKRGVPAPLLGVIGQIYRIVLGVEVHEEVKRRNPRGPNREMHHQYFDRDLRRLVSDDLIIIKLLSDQSRDKNEFLRRMQSHYKGDAFQLELRP